MIHSGLVDSYGEDGWAKVDALVPREEALALAEHAMELGIPTEATAGNFFAFDPEYRKMLMSIDLPSRTDDTFRSFCTQPWLGELMGRIIGCESVRLFRDCIFIKPAGVNLPTPMHQDLPRWPLDRRGPISIWLALSDLPAESGTLRYVSGSHRWGPLGRHAGSPTDDLFRDYPDLRPEGTAPHALNAGDATLHDGLTIHGTDANSTDKPRIAYSITYIPANTRYSGMPFWITNGLGLQVDKPLDHEFFPLVGE